MTESIKHIGKILKEARLKNGLTQRELGKIAKTPQNHISKIENGEVDLQASTLIELSRALNMELMFVPIKFVPTFQALLRPKPEGDLKQVPMYKLEQEYDDDE